MESWRAPLFLPPGCVFAPTELSRIAVGVSWVQLPQLNRRMRREVQTFSVMFSIVPCMSKASGEVSSGEASEETSLFVIGLQARAMHTIADAAHVTYSQNAYVCMFRL